MEENGRGPVVVLKAFRVLRAIFNDAVYSEKLDRSPVFKIELPEPPRRDVFRITPEDVMRLANTIHERYRVAVLMDGMLGLRWAEVAGLQHTDLDLDAGVAVIRHTLSEDKGLLHFTDTKNHRPKVVPLPPMLCRLLDEHIARFGADHEARASVYVNGKETMMPTASFVFTTEEGRLLRRNIYVDHFKPCRDQSGPPTEAHLPRPAQGRGIHSRESDLRRALGEDRSEPARPLRAAGHHGDLHRRVLRGRGAAAGIARAHLLRGRACCALAVRPGFDRHVDGSAPPPKGRLTCENDSHAPVAQLDRASDF